MTLIESIKIQLGTPSAEFNLTGIDEKKHSLEDFKDFNVLVIVFMCNHCPYVRAVWPKLIDLQEKYIDKGVRFVGINPNNNPDYPEEDLPHMKEYAKKYNMNFPYLIDETQETAKAYKAQCTPDIYVYNKERKLAYHGRVDDSRMDAGIAEENDLDEALRALIEGRPLKEEQYASMGCSIKWLD